MTLQPHPDPRWDLTSLDYELPPELIAQTPAEPRHAARMLVLDRLDGHIDHSLVADLPELLRAGDLLVVNESRVIPARLTGRTETGGRGEALLLRAVGGGRWEALVKPGRQLWPGRALDLGDGLHMTVLDRLESGARLVQLSGPGDAEAAVLARGALPLPPYIKGYTGDPERYQTVYARTPGSAAAPTAGLHLSEELLARIAARGVSRAAVTLHVGLDTFRPVKAVNLVQHDIHSEYCEVSAETAGAINAARERGGRVVAVGTTTVRTLETACVDGSPREWRGNTALFIRPGYRFRCVDAMLTNFHLPRSTLLALVRAFAGDDSVAAAYREAIKERYRFFSFGDAMFIHTPRSPS
ncbi:MAG: tRNA preQ1(34) S-adenosylmethionine ribosyltransferase-isomerase QueA [Chloroflexota bacterium]